MRDSTSNTRGSHSASRTAIGVCVIGLLAVLGYWAAKVWQANTAWSELNTATSRGDFETAAKLLEAYLAAHPQDRDGWELHVQLADAMHRPAQAAIGLGHLSEQEPASVDLKLRRGMALLKAQDLQSAEVVFREVLKTQPDHERAQTELQWILFNQLRERELEQFLESCLKRQPANPRLLFHLLMSAQKRPNPHESLPQLKAANAAVPNQRSVLLALARGSWMTGALDDATAYFEKLAAPGPLDAEAALTYAEFLTDTTRVDEDPTGWAPDVPPPPPHDWDLHDRCRWVRSQRFQQRGQYADALREVEAAYKLYPRSLTYLQARITLLRLLGRKEDAATLQIEADHRRAAEQRLGVIVGSGAVQHGGPELARELSELCHAQQRKLQADGWHLLAR